MNIENNSRKTVGGTRGKGSYSRGHHPGQRPGDQGDIGGLESHRARPHTSQWADPPARRHAREVTASGPRRDLPARQVRRALRQPFSIFMPNGCRRVTLDRYA